MYSIIIDVPARQLHLYNGSVNERTFPIAVGKPSTPTPPGTYTIIEKNPYPGGVFGSRWMGLSRRYYGVHGTDSPWLIGQAVSNGCIRMHNQDAEYVYDLVEIGTEVRILNEGTVVENEYEDHQTPSNAYIVQPGDSLWLIATAHHTTVDALIAANHLSPPYLIYPGQKIFLSGT